MSFPRSTYFFGCDGRSGHYLKGPGLAPIERENWGWADRMSALDGELAPRTEGCEIQHIAQLWRLTGFTPVPYSALSWWDRSVDRRPGSNIIIWAPGHTVSAEDVLELARRNFGRGVPALKTEIKMLSTIQERTWAPKAPRK